MKATDLMIGDYVEITGKGACRVKHINWPSQHEEMDAKLHPIPLTPEILEKNGFKKENGGKIMGFNIADSYELVYQGRTNFDKFWIYIQDFGESKKWHIKINGHFDISGFINDVHELQHALKLCGIDKEIVL